MFDEFREGFGNAVIELISGVISFALLVTGRRALVSSNYVGLFQLIELVVFIVSITLILKMESWGIGYLAGWLFAMGVLSNAGLVESLLFAIYIIVGGVVLIVKILRRVKEFFW